MSWLRSRSIFFFVLPLLILTLGSYKFPEIPKISAVTETHNETGGLFSAEYSDLLQSDSDSPLLPTDYVGVWWGSAVQQNPNVSWTVSMALTHDQIGAIVGTYASPTYGCGAELTLLEVNTNSVDLLQDFVFGNCWDLGTITLAPNIDGTLKFEWQAPNGTSTAMGTLSRVNTFDMQLPEEYTGVWIGSAIQVNPNVQWPILMTLSNSSIGTRVGIAGFAPYKCGAELYLLSVDTNSVELLEDVIYGSCWDQGSITLTPQEDGSLDYHWQSPDGTSYADGTVERISSPPQGCNLSRFGNINGEPIMQTDPSWSNIPYGGYVDSETGEFIPFIWDGIGQDNIGRWGCTLTAAAMNINYLARSQGVPFDTSPAELNEWLQKNDGYRHYSPIENSALVEAWKQHSDNINYVLTTIAGDKYVKDAYVNHSKVAEFAILMTSGLPNGPIQINPYSVPIPGRNDSLVNSSICSGNPVILNVRRPGYDHYVAASGSSSRAQFVDLFLHDPLANEIVTLNNTWEGTYYNYNVYERTMLSSSFSISASEGNDSISGQNAMINGGVQLLITDSLGRQTGFNSLTGTIVNEIPSSAYGEETLTTSDGTSSITHFILNIRQTITETYFLQVIGEGEFGLALSGVNSEGNVITSNITGSASTGSPAAYRVKFSPDSDDPVEIELNAVFLPLIVR